MYFKQHDSTRGITTGDSVLLPVEFTEALKITVPPTQDSHAVTLGYFNQKLEDLLTIDNLPPGVISVSSVPEFDGDFYKEPGTANFFLKSRGITPGTYTKVTVDNKGLVTHATQLEETDLPNIHWIKVINKPTTLAGYGITDVLGLSGGTISSPFKYTGPTGGPNHPVTVSSLETFITNYPDPIETDPITIGGLRMSLSDSTPDNYLRANGAKLPIASYTSLHSAIGQQFWKPDYKVDGKPWVNIYDEDREYITDPSAPTTESWSSSVNLLNATYFSSANKIVALGGSVDSSTPTSTRMIYTTVDTSTKLLNEWSSYGTFPIAISHAKAVSIGDRIYIIGGKDSSGNLLDTIYSFKVDGNGFIDGSITLESNSLPYPVVDFELVVVGKKIYLLGGMNDSNEVLNSMISCTVNMDGTLGNWSNSGLIGSPRRKFVANRLNDKIYLVGGFNDEYDDDGSFVEDVFSISIVDNNLTTFKYEFYLNVDVYIPGGITTSIGSFAPVWLENYNMSFVYFLNIPSGVGVNETGSWYKPDTAIVFGDYMYVLGGITDSSDFDENYYMVQISDEFDYGEGIGIPDGFVYAPAEPTHFFLPDLSSKEDKLDVNYYIRYI